MSKNSKILLAIIMVLLIIVSVLFTIIIVEKINNNKTEQPIAEKDITVQATSEITQTSNNINVVPTMQDQISGDSAWCGTFQLVWNDMKNEVVKNDIVFSPQEEMATNLNQGKFDKSMISDDYYYKIYDYKTKELKEKIEKEIQKKFNQTSDILNDFDWDAESLDKSESDERRYFFYTMLYRKFDYKNKFDQLESGNFGGSKYDNVNYFGIDQNTNENVGSQIKVLYYNSQSDFALLINTKTNDEVIFYKNPQGSTFDEIYENMKKNEEKYEGKKTFEKKDEFRAPYIEFNEKREYTELENKSFKTANPVYPTAEIAKAIQSIKLSLNETGGEIKSEAGMDSKVTIVSIDEKEKPARYFYVDDTFALFIRQKGKKLPYFAGKIEDITKYQ